MFKNAGKNESFKNTSWILDVMEKQYNKTYCYVELKYV